MSIRPILVAAIFAAAPCFSLCLTPVAGFAQQAKPAMQAGGTKDAMSGQNADQAYQQAMQAMDQAMQAMKPGGDADMDFVMMMKPHHQAAVDMAEAYLKYGSDPKLKAMARNIIASQKREIAEMNRWEAKHGM